MIVGGDLGVAIPSHIANEFVNQVLSADGLMASRNRYAEVGR
jgi:hypothetical protein